MPVLFLLSSADSSGDTFWFVDSDSFSSATGSELLAASLETADVVELDGLLETSGVSRSVVLTLDASRGTSGQGIALRVSAFMSKVLSMEEKKIGIMAEKDVSADPIKAPTMRAPSLPLMMNDSEWIKVGRQGQ